MTTSSDISNTDITSDLIASLVASYAGSTPAVSEVREVRMVCVQRGKPSKLATVKAAKAAKVSNGSQAAPVVRQLITSLPLPLAGTVNAKEFFVMLRRAKNRDECIVAIASYMGFDRTASYGDQEYAARAKAQNALRPIKALSAPVHSALPTLKGFVAGTPDHISRKVADLNGRMVVAAESLTDHLRAALSATTDTDRHFHDAKAQVERERIAQIRTDLASV